MAHIRHTKMEVYNIYWEEVSIAGAFIATGKG